MTRARPPTRKPQPAALPPVGPHTSAPAALHVQPGDPQQASVWLGTRAHERAGDTETATARGTSATATGAVRGSCEPSPTSPAQLRPQHAMDPFARSAQP